MVFEKHLFFNDDFSIFYWNDSKEFSFSLKKKNGNGEIEFHGIEIS